MPQGLGTCTSSTWTGSCPYCSLHHSLTVTSSESPLSDHSSQNGHLATSVYSSSYHLFFFSSKYLLSAWSVPDTVPGTGEIVNKVNALRKLTYNGETKTTNISYSDCDFCCVYKKSRHRVQTEVRDAILDDVQRRRHFSNDVHEVRERYVKTVGEECSRQKK